MISKKMKEKLLEKVVVIGKELVDELVQANKIPQADDLEINLSKLKTRLMETDESHDISVNEFCSLKRHFYYACNEKEQERAYDLVPVSPDTDPNRNEYHVEIIFENGELTKCDVTHFDESPSSSFSPAYCEVLELVIKQVRALEKELVNDEDRLYSGIGLKEKGDE